MARETSTNAWVELKSTPKTLAQRGSEAVETLPKIVPKLTLLTTLASLRRELVVADISAGIVVAIMLIPQSLAYAQLAGAPLITGYYSSILSCAVYPVGGPRMYSGTRRR